MTKAFSTFAAGSALLALSACTTHLDVGQGRPGSPDSRRGIAYFLPFTQFEAAITWSVSCDKQRLATMVPKVEVAQKSARDPAQVYVIDYSSLDAWNKTSSVKVDFYDSGAIKSINAAADDRSAEIAAKAISAVGKVAAFVAKGGVVEYQPKCTTDTVEALTAVANAKKEVGRLTTRLATETAALDAMTARVLRSGDSTTSQVRNAHDRLIGQVAATQFELDLAKKLLAAKREAVTYSDTVLFPEDGTTSETEEGQAVPVKQLGEWLDPASATQLADFAALSAVYFDLSTIGQWEKGRGYDDDGETFSAKERTRAGLRYRVGVPGKLTICQGAACSDTLAETREVLDTKNVTILQKGTTFYMPFSSAAFTNASLSATFSEGGVLTSAGYEQKRAAGEAVAGLADLLADQVVTVGGVIRDAKTTKLEGLKEQTDLAKAQKDLADAQKALIAAPKSDASLRSEVFEADTALKKAEIANLEAEIALRKARVERDLLGGD